jgi:hypothetical protein
MERVWRFARPELLHLSGIRPRATGPLPTRRWSQPLRGVIRPRLGCDFGVAVCDLVAVAEEFGDEGRGYLREVLDRSIACAEQVDAEPRALTTSSRGCSSWHHEQRRRRRPGVVMDKRISTIDDARCTVLLGLSSPTDAGLCASCGWDSAVT